jgi:CTP:molybdopterin cytidylyltransferase MocA
MLGGFKPLLPFASATLAEVSVRSALEAGCRVLLVVGNRGGEVAALFRGEERVLVVPNPAWKEGMVGSIQAALPAVEGEAFFVCHADMPFVRPGDYLALVSAWALRSGAALPAEAIFAASRDRAGHPVILPSSWIPDILCLERGGALKDFLAARPRFLVETGMGSLRDIDTPADYASATGACPGAGMDSFLRLGKRP